MFSEKAFKFNLIEIDLLLYISHVQLAKILSVQIEILNPVYVWLESFV